VLAELREPSTLAPLHNPPGTAGIDGARRALPGVPQVAVFDTAFHATLPEAVATYAIEQKVARDHGIRRYGFHGISVRFVVGEAARLLDRPVAGLNMIVLHLGNGAGATAVAGGRSVETSMGMTPLEGLVMGTRSGDLDPAVTFHLARAGRDLSEIEDLYQHRAGLAGLCGDNDMRTVVARATAGDPAAQLALDVYCHRTRKYVGAYHAVLGRLDAVVFTAGSASTVRWSASGRWPGSTRSVSWSTRAATRRAGRSSRPTVPGSRSVWYPPMRSAPSPRRSGRCLASPSFHPSLIN
jgi:acetate kinase